MNFLCDVHIPYKLVKYLQKNNCICFHVNQVFQDPKTKDRTISDYADSNDFIVITKDSDYKESHF